MANVTSGKQIRTDDFSVDDRPLVSKLAFQLNPFIFELSNAMQNNLTVAENLNMEYKTISVQVDASGTPIGNTKFTTNIASKGIIIVRAIGNGTYPTSQPFLSYIQQTNVITMQNITGLPANSLFSLTLLILGS